jgi:branched-chain amino acid transport system ATP-binding protein
MLQVEGLVKRYGGLLATDHLSLAVHPAEIHAIIGPNGAGKTTLINQLSGEVAPDEGRIVFDGRDVTREPSWRRALRGLSRSYQITSVFVEMTVQENVALAVQAHAGHSFHCWRPAARDESIVAPARAALAQTGLLARSAVRASDLAHGERRQLEIAMALAGKPKLLLLDEPMAGMSQIESEALVALLRSLKGHYAILLVEHDMDAVFALADRITVLVYGRPIASGTAEEIKANAQVREAYLGDEEIDS